MWEKSEPIYRIATHATSKAWRERKGRYRLMGCECPNCGARYFPNRFVCPGCHSRKLVQKEFNGKGIVTCTAIDHSPLMGHAEEVPKFLAAIKLDDGPTVISDVVDCPAEWLREGLRVEVTIRKWRRETNGNYMYGYKFRPSEEGK
jgi:uncharacterized OB-fold protein